LNSGPAGPVAALCGLSELLLTVIMAVKNKKMLTRMELLGLVLGVYGGLILVIP